MFNSILRAAKTLRYCWILKRSRLFDAKWYLQNYPDVREQKANPYLHYLNYGWKENRLPSPFFNGADYLQRYPDVGESNINPLIHYELFGKKENRSLLSMERLRVAKLNKEPSRLLAEFLRLNQTNLSTAFLHQKTFPPFKNKHAGQEIVIVATGPSADHYRPLPGAIHISVNRAFQLFDEISFQYAFIQDFTGKTPEYIDALDAYRPESCTKFYGLTNEWMDCRDFVIPESHAIKANALRYRSDRAHVPYFSCGFAYDIATMPLGCYGTIVFPALQFALWTHPACIYLVGCDCSLNGYAKGAGNSNFLYPDRLVEFYQQFKVFAAKYYPDIRIVSINPVGLRGVFEDMEMKEG